jgi:hypothetical protein
MRVELTIDGGFAYIPGLNRPLVVDDANLAADDAAQLRRLCAAAIAATHRKPASPPPTLPDARRYRCTIELDGVCRDFTAADPVNEPAIADLIAFLQDRRRGP